MLVRVVRKREAERRLRLAVVQRDVLLPGQRAGGPVADRVRSIDEPLWTITDRGVGHKVASQVFVELRDDVPTVTVDQVEKPVYRIPTMDEIRAVEPNGLVVVSTFSGAGGSCLGFRMAGFRIAYASEFVEAARATYRANADPSTYLDDRDIRQVSGASIRELSGIGDGELDVLEGSPPCASFSTAGRRQEHWGQTKSYSDTKQRTDDLFDEYVRLVRELRPRAFVAENVSGLVKGVAKGYYIELMRSLRESGYRVESRLLDAQWLGVPQARVRLLIVGLRDDVPGDPADAFPAPLPYRYSVRDALPEIDQVEGSTGFDGHAYRSASSPSEAIVASRPVRVLSARLARGAVGGGKATNGGSLDRPLPTVLVSHDAPAQFKVTPVRVVDRMQRSYVTENDQEAPSIVGYAIEREWNAVGPGGHSDRYLNLIRTNPDRPLATLSALGGGATSSASGVASVTHPFEPRKFSIDELRRLSGFPADFVLTGTYSQQWERIGRAVPPPMMAALARGVLSVLNGSAGRNDEL
jgi:DNA (cytosine-5)-methyltransferase 1